MSKYGWNSRRKIFYQPIEAAIRWSGLHRFEKQILNRMENTRPDPADLSRWPHLSLNLARIFDGLANGELPYGDEDGVTTRNPVLLKSPLLTIRHLDLKKWMHHNYPEERPAFLFDSFEQKLHPLINTDTIHTLLAERDALRVQLALCNDTQRRQRVQLAAQKKPSAIATTENQTLHPRSEKTYLNIVGGLLSLLLGRSPAGTPYSQFKTLEAIVSALLAHHEGKPGMSERTLWAKLGTARRQLDADRS